MAAASSGAGPRIFQLASSETKIHRVEIGQAIAVGDLRQSRRDQPRHDSGDAEPDERRRALRVQTMRQGRPRSVASAISRVILGGGEE